MSGNDPETHDEDVDIAGLCRCPEIQEGEDPPILMNILQIYSGSDTPEQAELNVVISDCMVDLDDTDYDSDTDSIAELEFYTWDDACVWEFRNTPEVFPPEIIQYSPAEGIWHKHSSADDDKYPEKLGHVGYADSDTVSHHGHIGQQENREESEMRNTSGLNIQRLYHKLTNEMDYPPSVVCYDWKHVMLLIRIMMSLSHDGDRRMNETEHDEAYDCLTSGILGCLPRCLCWPWVIEGVTQHLTEINGQGSDVVLVETIHGGVRRGVCTSDTPAEACPVAGRSLTLIGRRASLGGSVVNADWLHAIDAGDSPSGGVWIAFLGRTWRTASQLFLCQ